MNDDHITNSITNVEIEASYMSGRNEHFDQLMEWYVSNRLTPQQLTAHLLDAWTGAEWPREIAYWHMGQAGWERLVQGIVTMFRTAGFLTDDPATSLPTEPMRVYRGCTDSEHGRDGFSWTTDPEIARRFAKREALFSHDPEGYPPIILVANIWPEGILAIVKHGRNEAEVIVDPNCIVGLDINDLDTPDISGEADAIFVEITAELAARNAELETECGEA